MLTSTSGKSEAPSGYTPDDGIPHISSIDESEKNTTDNVGGLDDLFLGETSVDNERRPKNRVAEYFVVVGLDAILAESEAASSPLSTSTTTATSHCTGGEGEEDEEDWTSPTPDEDTRGLDTSPNDDGVSLLAEETGAWRTQDFFSLQFEASIIHRYPEAQIPTSQSTPSPTMTTSDAAESRETTTQSSDIDVIPDSEITSPIMRTAQDGIVDSDEIQDRELPSLSLNEQQELAQISTSPSLCLSTSVMDSNLGWNGSPYTVRRLSVATLAESLTPNMNESRRHIIGQRRASFNFGNLNGPENLPSTPTIPHGDELFGDADNSSAVDGKANNTMGDLLFSPDGVGEPSNASAPPQKVRDRFPHGIEYFCFPEGLFLLEKPREPRFHSFLHTAEDGSRMIGCALVFCEPLSNAHFSCLCRLLLKYGYPPTLLSPHVATGDVSFVSAALSKTRNSTQNHTPASLAAISTAMSMEFTPKKTVYVEKALVLLSKYPFLTAFKRFLTTLYRLSTLSPPSFVPLERYICNFVDDVPAPPPGKVDILYYMSSYRVEEDNEKEGNVEKVPHIPRLETEIRFCCPQLNEPHAWSGFPLFPLFECLSAEHICKLFIALTLERQVLFISSQLSLLTLCAEAITSLLYPLRWVHAYIPILPSRLLGALGAPFPFIFGLPNATYLANRSLVSSETIRVFLDEDRMEGFPSIPLPVPERRYVKLLAHVESVIPWYRRSGTESGEGGGNVGSGSGKKSGATSTSSSASSTNSKNKSNCGSSSTSSSKSRVNGVPNIKNSKQSQRHWKITRLPFFDAALSTIAEEPMTSIVVPDSLLPPTKQCTSKNSTASSIPPKSLSQILSKLPRYEVNDAAIREGFLKFFSAVFMTYKRFLVYSADLSSDSGIHFRADEFIASCPPEWEPYLREVLLTQAFSQFVDERVSLSKLDRDVIFFDESIDAKLNRYALRRLGRSIDTPFLAHAAYKHVKTYVPPSVVLSDLDRRIGRPPTVPFTCDPKWYISPRGLTAAYSSSPNSLLEFFAQIRLKRKVRDSHKLLHTPAASAVYSAYLVSLCQCISRTIEKTADRILKKAKEGLSPTVLYILESNHLHSKRGRSFSGSVSTPLTSSNKVSSGRLPTAVTRLLRYAQRLESVHASILLSLRVAVETLNCLTNMDYAVEEVALRHLLEAAADANQSQMAAELLVLADSEGIIPDHQLRHALLRSMTTKGPLRSVLATLSLWAAEEYKLAVLESQTKPDSHGQFLPLPSFMFKSFLTSHGVVETGVGEISLRPQDVWAFSDWSALQRSKPAVLLRSNVSAQVGGTVRIADHEQYPIAKLFFNTQSALTDVAPGIKLSSEPQLDSGNNGSASHGHNTPRRSRINSSADGLRQSRDYDESSTSSTSSSRSALVHGVVSGSTVTPAASASTSLPVPSPPIRYWSENPVEGEIPDVPWKKIGARNLDYVFTASSRLRRQVRIAEVILAQNFPDLVIDLSSPLGMACPNPACPCKRSLTLVELHRGWKADPNVYTTTCVHCGRDFIPRFSVCRPNTPTWIGSDGPQSMLWCEYLSPWTLQKELLNVVFDGSDEASLLVSCKGGESQHSVVFWNLVIASRLRGLPIAFLLVGGNIVEAFPPNQR